MSTQVFLLDENVSAKTGKRLISKNFKIKTVNSEKLLGSKNGFLLNLCKQQKWILITHDQDFLSPTIKDHYGIIVVKIHPAIDSISGVVLENFLESVDATKIICKIIIMFIRIKIYTMISIASITNINIMR